MKGNRRQKALLALGLVAMACLVLAGCPHNGLLDSGGGAGGIGGGSRGGGGGVQLVITNFVADGPQRTIAPEHIDLKGNANQYVFIATGKGGGTYGPEFITVDANGFAGLNISGGGIWEVSVSAYEVAKLTGKTDINGTSNTDIMAQDTPQEVMAIASALILQGKATVDLGSGSQVTMTLTSDGVGTEGGVDVTINFQTATDVTEINSQTGKARYKVKVALYDYTTGDIVQTTDAQSTEVEVHNGAGDMGASVTYDKPKVPRGRYNFRMTVTTDAGDPVAYWSDDIYVEGNRTTTASVDVYNLFNKPSDPTGFDVFRSKKRAGDAKDGYLAYFGWAGMSYNAAGMEIQIADITRWYKYEGAQHKVTLDGGDTIIADHADLWNKIDTLTELTQVKYSDVVTTLSWKNSPQDAMDYPAIWQGGSLMNGSSSVAFLMQTGHVYSARVRADGGLLQSDWLVLGEGVAGTTQPNVLTGVAAGGQATKLNLADTNGLFNVHEMFYDLGDNYLLYQTPDGMTLGTVANTDKLSVYREYNPDNAWYDVDVKYQDMQAPTAADWFIYPRNPADGTLDSLDDRVKTWTGWQNKYNSTDRYVAATWGEYKGHDNLHLIPIGAGGSVMAQAETSGTFDVLTADTVLVQITADGNLGAFDELTNGGDHPVPGTGDAKSTRLSLLNDTANNRYILNLDAAGTNKTWLHLSAGSDPTTPGVLEDKNSNQFNVNDITVTLVKGNVVYTTFDKVSRSEAKAQLDGIPSGDYTLKVVITASSGYPISYQTSFVVKYNDQVIP